MNVNRLEQSACKLAPTDPRTEIRAAANIRLKEILKGGLYRNTNISTFYLHLWLNNSGAYQSPFLKTSLIPSSLSVIL